MRIIFTKEDKGLSSSSPEKICLYSRIKMWSLSRWEHRQVPSRPIFISEFLNLEFFSCNTLHMQAPSVPQQVTLWGLRFRELMQDVALAAFFAVNNNLSLSLTQGPVFCQDMYIQKCGRQLVCKRWTTSDPAVSDLTVAPG